MAIQNFLSGGYYGKLGDTVGQRYHNKRIIREYVIPQNPRTPEQQANRKLFGSYVPYAQLGMSANYRSPAFDLAENSEWAFRMKAAAELYKNGERNLGLIPLYPINFEVPSVIDKIVIDGYKENQEITFLLSGDVPQTARAYTMLMFFADGERAGQIILLSGETSAEEPAVLVCVIEDTSEIDTAEIYCRICTRDDTTTDTIAASAQLLAEKNLTQEFQTALTLYNASTDTNGTITLIYTTENEYSADTSGNFGIAITSTAGTADLKNGTSVTLENGDFTPNFEFISIDDLFSLKIALEPIYSASNTKNFTTALNLTANFQNFCTDKTTPATATEQISYSAQWQNSQPSATVTTQAAIASTDANGTITTFIQTLAPYSEETAEKFTYDISIIGLMGTLKDGTALNKTNLTFSTNFEVLDHNGYCRPQYILTPNHNASDIKDYDVTIDFNFSIQNYYTAETMPADIIKNSSANIRWTNSQSAYNLTLGTPTTSTELDGTATITIPITSEMPTNANGITVALNSVSGEVGEKTEAIWNYDENFCTGTETSYFTWSVKDISVNATARTITCKLYSPNGQTEINGYTVRANVTVNGANLYTASTMPSGSVSRPLTNISTPKFWQPQATINNNFAVTVASARKTMKYGYVNLEVTFGAINGKSKYFIGCDPVISSIKRGTFIDEGGERITEMYWDCGETYFSSDDSTVDGDLMNDDTGDYCESGSGTLGIKLNAESYCDGNTRLIIKDVVSAEVTVSI